MTSSLSNLFMLPKHLYFTLDSIKVIFELKYNQCLSRWAKLQVAEKFDSLIESSNGSSLSTFVFKLPTISIQIYSDGPQTNVPASRFKGSHVYIYHIFIDK